MDSIFGETQIHQNSHLLLQQLALSPLLRYGGKFGGFHACGGTFSYILALLDIFLTRLFSKLRLKRKDFREIVRLTWAQEAPGSNPGAPTTNLLKIVRSERSTLAGGKNQSTQLPVQLLFEFIVEDNPTNLAANAVNFLSPFVIQAVEVGIVTCFLSFDEPVIDRLSSWNQAFM